MTLEIFSYVENCLYKNTYRFLKSLDPFKVFFPMERNLLKLKSLQIEKTAITFTTNINGTLVAKHS